MMAGRDTNDEDRRKGEVSFIRIEDVTPVPIGNVTVAHDQGWSRNLVSTQACGSPDLLMSNFRMDPFQHHPLHTHDNVGEIYFILEGRARLQVGDRVEWVEKHTTAYIPAGTQHGIDTGPDPVSVLIVFPEGDFGNVHKRFVEPDAEPIRPPGE
ncbi:cupin domain-containing protein [Nocardia pseudovaccinii]|uniref:cupin domain-containing protein n=1 Tax=Nocardia pseudovaccinii TaxID=189540 RepID=UPI003D930E1F